MSINTKDRTSSKLLTQNGVRLSSELKLNLFIALDGISFQ